MIQMGSYNLNRFEIKVRQHGCEDENTTLVEKASLKDMLVVNVH